MKVKTLIAKLKKMPQELDVKYAHQDNYEEEAAGETCGVILFEKENYDRDAVHDKDMFDSMPDRCIIIRG